MAAAVGLACAGFGLYGVIDSIRFGIGAERAIATVVGVVHTGEGDVDVLEFTASDRRRYRVEARGAWRVLWGPSHALNARVPVLYRADSPEGARLADFAPRFPIPLILLVLGCMFTPAGLLVWRYGCRPERRCHVAASTRRTSRSTRPGTGRRVERALQSKVIPAALSPAG